jgi:hypothetical protein
LVISRLSLLPEHVCGARGEEVDCCYMLLLIAYLCYRPRAHTSVTSGCQYHTRSVDALRADRGLAPTSGPTLAITLSLAASHCLRLRWLPSRLSSQCSRHVFCPRSQRRLLGCWAGVLHGGYRLRCPVSRVADEGRPTAPAPGAWRRPARFTPCRSSEDTAPGVHFETCRRRAHATAGCAHPGKARSMSRA